MYLLKLSVRPWRLHPMTQLMSVASIGFVLFLCGFLYVTERGLRVAVHSFETKQVVTAFMDPLIPKGSEKVLVDAIRMNLGAAPSKLPYDVQFVGTRDFLETLQQYSPNLAEQLSSLGPDLDGTVPRYVSIIGDIPEKLVNKLKTIPGVESIESSKERFQPILGAYRLLNRILRFLVLGLCVVLLLGLVHVNKMNLFLQKDAIHLLKYWGADPLVLRMPGAFLGLLNGMIGGSIGALSWYLVGSYFADKIRSVSPILKEVIFPSAITFSVQLFLVGTLTGIISGILGTFFSDLQGKNG